LILSTLGFAQQDATDFNLSPNGILDNVFDNYGNRYQLSNISVGLSSATDGQRSTLFVCDPSSLTDQ